MATRSQLNARWRAVNDELDALRHRQIGSYGDWCLWNQQIRRTLQLMGELASQWPDYVPSPVDIERAEGLRASRVEVSSLWPDDLFERLVR